MVLESIPQESQFHIDNGHNVSCLERNSDSPIVSRDAFTEHRLSTVSPSTCRSSLSAVPFTYSSSSLVNDNGDSCQNASPSSNEKKVKFMVDPCDLQNVKCRTYETTIRLTKLEVKSMWYKSSEIKKIRDEVHHEVLEARSLAFLYLKQFQQLHTKCNGYVSDESSTWCQLAHEISASQYRGMESRIFNETTGINQRNVVIEVLATQEVFKDLLTVDELNVRLQTQSTKLSQCSSRLARMIGIGDDNEASRVTTARKKENQLAREKMMQRSQPKYEAENDIISTLFEI